MTVAEKLDYSVSCSAAVLKSGQSFRIVLLTSETITTWFSANIFTGLDSALRPSGYDTVPYPMRNAAERHNFFVDLPVRRNADAVIVSSSDIEPAEVERLKYMHVPTVGINTPSTDGSGAGVSIDDYATIRSTIEHLITLGHRHVAFVGSAPTEINTRYSVKARLQGVIDAAVVHPGIELTPLSIQRGLGESNAALNTVLNASSSITTLCSEDDEMIVPVPYRLRQCGRRILQDISIIGFDDSTLPVAVGLTTLHQDPFAMGVAAGHMVLDAITGKSIEPVFVRPDTPLILRETTVPPAVTVASAQAWLRYHRKTPIDRLLYA